ncbi:hypothetical protein AB4Y96_08935, partial [Phyllobacterium sp. TAF24]|uniref:hypothetical protein n=1 Tax=Phyllobacterium sp. TAF24 TaxID=3233068 RepID=UPI003F9BBA19
MSPLIRQIKVRLGKARDVYHTEWGGGSWFDKLTMRERGDERESSSATFVICKADDYRCIPTLPHGEPVEP